MNNGLRLFTAVHTPLSVAALLSGALMIRQLFRGIAESISVYVFLVTAAATMDCPGNRKHFQPMI